MISVILPVYNAEEYLRKCLDSIIDSSYKNLEIICINDGSLDHSLDILLDYQRMDSRITVIDQKNAGVSCARNLGIRHSNGEYIAFCDADDWISPDFFDVMLSQGQEADVIICNAYFVENDNYTIQKHVFGKSNIRNNNEIRNIIVQSLITPNDDTSSLLQGVWNKLYRRNLVQQYDLHFEEGISFAEDWELSQN